jgi:vacuolar-type H+-ATPase subunit F/Vma7
MSDMLRDIKDLASQAPNDGVANVFVVTRDVASRIRERFEAAEQLDGLCDGMKSPVLDRIYGVKVAIAESTDEAWTTALRLLAEGKRVAIIAE